MGFAGLKVSGDPAATRKGWGVRAVTIDQAQKVMLTGRPGVIGWGGNSGFCAVNLAVQFGCRRILLVGFDMQVAGGMHWHGAHPRGMNNPSEESTARWRKALDDAAPDLVQRGVEVINTSAVSALTAFPKIGLMEAMDADRDLAIH